MDFLRVIDLDVSDRTQPGLVGAPLGGTATGGLLRLLEWYNPVPRLGSSALVTRRRIES